MKHDPRDPLHLQREREAKARDRRPLMARLVQGRTRDLHRSATKKLEREKAAQLGRKLTRREKDRCKSEASQWVAEYLQRKADGTLPPLEALADIVSPTAAPPPLPDAAPFP